MQSGLEGWFSFQPQAHAFVGRQTLEDYERDRPKSNSSARNMGKNDIHPQAVCDHSVTIFKLTMYFQKPCDDSNKWHLEGGDHGLQMDVNGTHSGFGFNNEECMSELFLCHSFTNRNCKDQVPSDREDQVMNDPPSQNNAPVQPLKCYVLQAPQQFDMHHQNTRQHQIHGLPSPPISCSSSIQVGKNNPGNVAEVRNVVHHGDELVSNYSIPWVALNILQADTNYDVLSSHHANNHWRRSPDLDYLTSVQDGTSLQNDHMLKHHQKANDSVRADPQRVYGIPTAQQEHPVPVPQANQVPVIQCNYAALSYPMQSTKSTPAVQSTSAPFRNQLRRVLAQDLLPDLWTYIRVPSRHPSF